MILFMTMGIAALYDAHFEGYLEPIYRWMYSLTHPTTPVVSSTNKVFWQSTCTTYFFYLTMVALAVPSTLIAFIAHIVSKTREKKIRKQMTQLMSGQGVISADEFLSSRRAQHSGSASELTGVYILHNVSRDMYYVGQSVRVIQRVTQHFTGRGNGDVYADYRNGEEFTIRTISLASSGYQSLNDLERDAILAYDAYRRGYNKTRGNQA